MTNADIMILAYPAIAAAVMAAAAVGMIFWYGYNKPEVRGSGPDMTGDAQRSDVNRDATLGDGVLMKLTEAEASRVFAERATRAQRQPEKATT